MEDLLLRRRNLLEKQEVGNIRAVCFEADGDQTVSITKNGSAPAITMQYSYNGRSWNTWDLSALSFGGNTKVYVRGVNNARFASSNCDYNHFTFGTNAYVFVSGIIESLLDYENEVLQYSMSYIFTNLFHNQTALREADKLKFEAMKNSEACYRDMFSDCTNLLTAPELPATTLGYIPYKNMFSYCRSLIKAPSILPATTLGIEAYSHMFSGCTSLEEAPELPAETLQGSCYYAMFSSCARLKTIRCHAKVTANNATYIWLQMVASSGTFYGHSEYGWTSGGDGIPKGWKFVELTD